MKWIFNELKWIFVTKTDWKTLYEAKKKEVNYLIT